MATWIYNDGGREAAGYKGVAGDCVTRAIAIATERPYKQVYDAMNDLAKNAKRTAKTPKKTSARKGIYRDHFQEYLTSLGWEWVPTMKIGSGCQVHLDASELPAGRILAKLSRHLCAVIDGVIHDIYDPSRGGSRCVYGYYRKLEAVDLEDISEENHDEYDDRAVATFSLDRGGNEIQVIATSSGYVIGANYADGDQEFQVRNSLTGDLDTYPASKLDAAVANNPTRYPTYKTIGAAIDARI